MTPSWRKPVGVLVILLALAIWATLAVSLVDRLAPPPLARALAYVVAGFLWLWALPMKRMLRWMELGIWRDG